MSPYFDVKTPHSSPLFFLSIFAFWLAFGSILSTKVEAQANLPFPEMADWGATTMSMGGASAASVSDHDAFLNNPAGLIYFEKKYSLAGHWLNAPRNQKSYSASFIDGTKDLLSGFHFSSTDYGRPHRYTYSLAFAYKTPYGSLGFNTEALQYSGITGTGKGWHFTGTVGMLIPVAYHISIGATFKSLLDREKNHEVPPLFKLGIMYSVPGKVRLAFDADKRIGIPHQDWNYSVGGDYLMTQYFALRGGYHFNHSTDYSFWSSGAGVLAPRAELFGFFMQTTSGRRSNGFGTNLMVRF